MKAVQISFVLYILVLLLTGCEPEEKLFFKAVAANDLAEAGRLLENGVDVDLADGQGRTALMQAVLLNETEMINFLLENNADVLRTDADGNTVYDLAVQNDLPDLTTLLLTRGIEVGQSYWINSEGGLRLRDQPGLEGARITTVPDRTEVRMLKRSYFDVTVDGGTGRWCLVDWNGTRGWLFDFYLTDYLAPLTAQVTGEIGYPSEGVPPMRVFAENLGTQKVHQVDSYDKDGGYQYYDMELPPGRYIFYCNVNYGDGNQTPSGGAFYTGYSRDGYRDNAVFEHVPIMVDLKAGGKPYQANLHDWYANEGHYSSDVLASFRKYAYRLHGPWTSDKPLREGSEVYNQIQFCLDIKESLFTEEKDWPPYEGKYAVVYEDEPPGKSLTYWLITGFFNEGDILVLEATTIRGGVYMISVDIQAADKIHAWSKDFDQVFVRELDR